MAWFILQTRPMYEMKIVEEINKKINEENLPILQVIAPERPVIDFKNGKKIEKMKKIYPNYVFINMEFSDIVWHSLKKIKGIVGFLGNRDKPNIISDKEMEKILSQAKESAPKPKVEYNPGAEIRVKDGMFKDFIGVVQSADYEKNKIKVSVTIFNRETDVEIGLDEVELLK